MKPDQHDLNKLYEEKITELENKIIDLHINLRILSKQIGGINQIIAARGLE